MSVVCRIQEKVIVVLSVQIYKDKLNKGKKIRIGEVGLNDALWKLIPVKDRWVLRILNT